MYSMLTWTILIALSLAALILTAAERSVGTHSAVAATVCIVMAIFAVFEHRRNLAAGLSELGLSAISARHMGAIWAWGALSLIVTYAPQFGILRWPEWLSFVLASGAFAIISLGFAIALSRQTEGSASAERLLRIGRYVSMGQLAGMLIAMVGLVIDGKFPAVMKPNPNWQDWAANNIFFFGALALAIITANALFAQKGTRTGQA
ncbi:MAG: hypothetical protein AAGG72_01585 [Pseudomonadota bacterium]